MNALERQKIIHRHLVRSRWIIESCKLPLPPPPSFKFPVAVSTRSTLEDMRLARERFAQIMTMWWDWLDACRDSIEKQRNEQIKAYDWSVVDDAFGRFTGLEKIFGNEYDICISLLGARRPWASKTTS